MAGYQTYGSPYHANATALLPRIGKALIGKTVGDRVEVQTPRGAKSYEVMGVAFK